MRFKTRAAKLLRSLGAESLVESPRIRSLLGAPIYKRMLPQDSAAPLPASAAAASTSSAAPAPQTLAPTGPKLSVIIPAYNVEAYLQDCVKSVTDQTYRNLDIVIVDDGSTDGTPLLADRIAAADPRIRVVHKKNGGLGRARNTGLDHSTGEYITFVDSDDLIVKDAYEVMMASLLRTGSDLVIGAIERFDSKRSWTPAWVREVHGEDRFAITGEDFPPILWDVFSWNKVYRRDSWERIVGAFPEGLYEDQEGTAKLFTSGAKFDVLTKVVYRWRLRDDGTSITQNKSSVDDLSERLTVARRVKTIIENSGNQELIDYWYGKLLCEDIYYYYREVPRAEQEFWELLVENIAEFFDAISLEVLQRWPLVRRLLTLAAARNDRSAFDTVLLDSLERGESRALRQINGQWIEWVPAIDSFEVPVPEGFLQVSGENIDTRTVITDIQYGTDGSVTIAGFTYLVGLESLLDRKMTAALYAPPVQGITSTFALPLSIRSTESPLANPQARSAYVDYGKSGFEITISAADIDRLAEILPTVQSDHLELRLSIEQQGLTCRDIAVDNVDSRGTGASLHASVMTEAGVRVVPVTLNPGFGLRLLSPRFIAEGVSLNRGQLSMRVSINPREKAALQARLKGQHPSIVVTHDKTVVTAAELPLSDNADHWDICLTLPERHRFMESNVTWLAVEIRAVGLASSIAARNVEDLELSGQRYILHATQYGFLEIGCVSQYGSVDSVTFDANSSQLKLTGTVFLDSMYVRQTIPSFALVGREENLLPSSLTFNAETGEYDCCFVLQRQDVNGREVVVRTDTYIFEILTATGRKLPPSVWLRRGRFLETQLPLRDDFANSSLRIEPAGSNSGLVVKVGPGIEAHMSGAYAQYRGAAAFVHDTRELEDAVFFESFGGRAIADTPKRLDAYVAEHMPEIPRYWTVRDGSLAVPEGAIPLTMYSEEWFEKLSTARFLVNNNNFPFFFKKHPEQRYLQTWHGTPLKRIGNDVPSQNLSLSYRALMQREVTYWDGLVAQSQWAGPVLANAFGFEGETMVLGYPRNDSIVQDLVNGERRAHVRRHLGIADGQIALLYAPTWRDDSKTASGHYAHTLYLDFAALLKKFGYELVVLQRGHVNTAQASSGQLPRNVINVNEYPDINDLYLAADVLVTDYSSVMFDFVLTRKPMIFLAPDIDQYRDVTRGFYFDFESVSPGPIVANTGQVIAHLEDLRLLDRDYHKRYEAFLKQFAPLDDGHAGGRVGRAFFG